MLRTEPTYWLVVLLAVLLHSCLSCYLTTYEANIPHDLLHNCVCNKRMHH